MRIYPSNGSTGFRASYVAHAAVTRRPAGRGGALERRRLPGHPGAAQRRVAGALPGQRTGRAHRRRRGSGPSAAGYDWLLAVGDVTGDRRPDLLARERSTGTLWTLPGTSTGFGARKLFMGSLARFDLAG